MKALMVLLFVALCGCAVVKDLQPRKVTIYPDGKIIEEHGTILGDMAGSGAEGLSRGLRF